MQPTSGIQPKYKNYDRQKCFVGHSLGAEWCEDLQSACAEVLPKFNLEPWYAADHFTPTQTLRDKVVELIANSRFGIYDISSWKDRDGNWQLPRNVYIELGIAIALNRPTLLLRHTSNKELNLPTCLQSIKILEFAGDVTLKKALEAQLPQWIDVPPDRDWLNRFCIFGNQVCSFREKHPCAQQWGQEKIHCHVSDGVDKNNSCYHQSECDEIRGAFEDIFNRYSDLTFNYLDEISIADNYQYLLCSHCQTVRSTPFAIYRILPNTSAETFIAIGVSIALEKLFENKIPKIILVKNERDLPSLLRGYEVVEAVNSKEIKQKLKNFLPTVLKMVRETIWRPRLLPFAETIILYSSLPDTPELELSENSEDKEPTADIPIEELRLSPRVYNCLKRAQINTLADLLNYTQDDLLELKNFWKKSLEEVVEALQRRFGISLPRERLYIPASSIKGKLRKYLEEADESSTKSIEKTDLIRLAIEIEREFLYLIANMGLLEKFKGRFLADVKLLQPYGFTEIEKADYFWSIRNKSIHGLGIDSDDISLAVESGLSLLKSFQSIPHEVNIVYHPGVLVYSDPDCTRVQESVKGVILEKRRHPSDALVGFFIFPTTLTRFTKGKVVSWEWKRNKVWEAAWYRDPDTDEIKSGWSSSYEFVGRDLDNLHGA